MMSNELQLEAFCEDFLRNPSTTVLEHRDYGKLVADVVFRSGLFQVEKVTVSIPDLVVAAHRHPNIDAIEVHLSGDMVFIVAESPERVNKVLRRVRPFAASKIQGRKFLVKSTDWHGAKCGAAGASFYSIQRWTGAVPMTAAGVDWEGPELCG